MKSQADIEKLLEDFGKTWPEDASIVEGVMQKIQSTPLRPRSPKLRRIIMRSLIGIAASVSIFALVWWAIEGNRNSLYAQVIDAVRKAQTLHMIQFAQPKDGAQPIKATEQWFERGVGFRMEGFGQIRLGNDEYIWSFTKDRNLAILSRSNGIDKAITPIFAQIDQLAQELQNEYKRYPEGDQEIDGTPCKAYVLTKTKRIADSSFKSGERRGLIYLDQQSRLVRGEIQRREDNHYYTESFISYKYDEHINPALFKPDFGKDVKIVDADMGFDEFVNLKSAVHVEERSGLIYAIHRVERFENGGVLVVSSVRGTEETLKKYPLTKRWVRPGEFLVDGPARDYDASPQWPGFFRFRLASASHQGIDLSWWAVIPRGERANWFEVAPGRIKLTVGVTPEGEFAKLFADERGVINHLRWDIELNDPRPATIPTLEDVTNRIYADQVALEDVRFKSLDISCHGKHDESDISKITAAEYAKAVANMFRSWMESDIDFQLEYMFDTKRPKSPHLGNRVPIGLMYNPEVSDTTLERIAKRDSITELYLQGTRITDEGLKHLSGLTKLQILDLAETSISDVGLKHLTGLSNLKHIYLTDTKVTAAGVAMLKKAIPGVVIEWNRKK